MSANENGMLFPGYALGVLIAALVCDPIDRTKPDSDNQGRVDQVVHAAAGAILSTVVPAVWVATTDAQLLPTAGMMVATNLAAWAVDRPNPRKHALLSVLSLVASRIALP